MKRTRFLTASVVLAITVGLSACGSGGHSSQPASAGMTESDLCGQVGNLAGVVQETESGQTANLYPNELSDTANTTYNDAWSYSGSGAKTYQQASMNFANDLHARQYGGMSQALQAMMGQCQSDGQGSAVSNTQNIIGGTQPTSPPTVSTTQEPSTSQSPPVITVSPNVLVPDSVRGALAGYFWAINTGNYQAAYNVLGPSEQQQISEQQFAAGESGVQDTNITVVSAQAQGSSQEVVDLHFTSHQPASSGPNGDTCDNWTLDYTVTDYFSQWVIASTAGHNGVTHQPCG